MEESAVELSPEMAASLDQASESFVGRWNTLVSSTNWEKGRIIYEWRERLIDASAPASEHSDEAWARRVGGVSGQHVGRLRRVYHRFGETRDKYQGVYWSHFQAALDWDDAEMWLEGAAQSKWSVSKMRQHRYETVGGVKPEDAATVVTELDEDFVPLSSEETAEDIQREFDESKAGPRFDGPDFGDEEPGAAVAPAAGDAMPGGEGESETAEPPVRPFENLPEMPDDLADAFDQFKLAVLKHKRSHWEEITLQDVLRALDALKTLAAAPADDEGQA